MLLNTGTESQFEETIIDRLKALGYRYQYGSEIERPNAQTVVLVDVLRDYLQRRYRRLPPAAIEDAIEQITNLPGVNLERRNMAFQRLFRSGLILNYEEDEQPKSAHIYLADFEQPELNDFLAVNQFAVRGPGPVANDRRPDLIIYLNGLPLVVFELKNPWHPQPTVADAYNQLQHYTNDIPQLFTFNAFCVISDGNVTLHGVHTASLEWYAAWKSIDGRSVEPPTTSTAKTLIEGLFPKNRLLNYLRNFIVHEEVNEKIDKKGAKYHQFFAVNFAVEQAVRAMQPDEDKRAGVVWHTQGSGKSLEMVFMIGILRRWPSLNPSIIVQVDRTDLDDQLYGSLVAAKALIGDVVQAKSVDDLRSRLRTQGGEVICTTIEKFTLKNGESEHPRLSERHNILIVADEAHRTQYGFSSELRRSGRGFYTSQGFARNMRQALPNAAYIGFTGTPIDKEDANTIQIFGDYIHIYDMQQAKEDNAVVPIYYEARHIPLKLVNPDIDREVDALAEESQVDATQLEVAKAKWSAIEQAAGVEERLQTLAEDLLAHFNSRQEALSGKAMIVSMSRRNAVNLYSALTARADCPPVKVVMTGNLSDDPPEWSQAGHITTKAARNDIKRHFIDPDDPLKLVIVVDMWLTGFDAPCVNTLYVDKLMRGHNLMQAIARVNRIFQDKPGGLIVDYIGIDDRLKEAARKYTVGGGRGSLTADLEKDAVAYFLRQLQITRSNMPNVGARHPGETMVLQTKTQSGTPRPYGDNIFANWRNLSNIQLEDLTSHVYGTLIQDEEHKDDFLSDEYKLSKAFSLIKHLPAGQQNSAEVGFYQLIRQQLRKLDPAAAQKNRQLESAVHDLLDESVAARPAVDIFAVAGLDRPDVSILDEKFLIGHGGDKGKEDLQVRLLAKLLSDDIENRKRKNIVRYRSYKEMLEDALKKYNNRVITAQEVVEVMLDIRQQQNADVQRQADLGLSDEELAFYDVIVLGNGIDLHQTDEWIADLVRQVVKTVRENLEVDWTKPHRRNVEAAVESGVGRVLRRNKIKGEQFHFLRARLMKQARATYQRWPMAV